MKKYLLGGAMLGFLTVLYDYDFLLNSGGPNTPITDFFMKLIFPNQFMCCLNAFLINSFIFIIAGSLLGFFGWLMTRKLRGPLN